MHSCCAFCASGVALALCAHTHFTFGCWIFKYVHRYICGWLERKAIWCAGGIECVLRDDGSCGDWIFIEKIDTWPSSYLKRAQEKLRRLNTTKFDLILAIPIALITGRYFRNNNNNKKIPNQIPNSRRNRSSSWSPASVGGLTQNPRAAELRPFTPSSHYMGNRGHTLP